jgi:hypothetical protein
MMNASGLGYETTEVINGGKLSQMIYNDGYATPYPIKFQGLLLKSALSTSYDATATPTYAVAIPCGAGERPTSGYAFVTTRRTDQYGNISLFEGLDNYLPLPADRTGGSSAYTQDKAKFAEVTSYPFIPGATIGVPVIAGANIVVGNEIASASGGFATVATSGNVVIGVAESPANNVAGTSGAITIRVKVGHFYTK